MFLSLSFYSLIKLTLLDVSKPKNNNFTFTLDLFSGSLFTRKKTKKDSTETSSETKKISKKREVTNFIKRIIFKPSKIKKKNKTLVEKTHLSDIDGKIIRNIRIITLDPFGLSDTDSTMVPKIGEKEQETGCT